MPLKAGVAAAAVCVLLLTSSSSAAVVPIVLPFDRSLFAAATSDTLAALLRNASEVANAAEAGSRRRRPPGPRADAWIDVHARLRMLAFLAFPGAAGPSARMSLQAEVVADGGSVWVDVKASTPRTRSSLHLAARNPASWVPLCGVLSEGVLYADPALLPARCDAGGCRVGGLARNRSVTAAAAAGAVERALRASMAAAAAPRAESKRGAHSRHRALSAAGSNTRKFLLLRVAWNDTTLIDAVDVDASAVAPSLTQNAADGTAPSAADLALAARQVRDFFTNATGGLFPPDVTAPADCLYTLNMSFSASHRYDLFADVANAQGLLWSAVATHPQPACRVAASYDYLLAFHPVDAQRAYGGVAAVGQPASFYNGPWATVGWWGFTHELGHSLGLRHAFAIVDGEPVEYAGSSDVMGRTPVAPPLGLMYSAAEKHAMHILPPATLFEADAALAQLPRRSGRTTLLGIERPDFPSAAALSGGHVGIRWQRTPPGSRTAAAPWTSRWAYAT